MINILTRNVTSNAYIKLGRTKTNTHGYRSYAHVLGIETSCDDTGVSIVRQDGKILSNCVNSQLRQHLDNGGIIPMMAKEYHVSNIDEVARQAFRESNLRSVGQDIDAIAVTTRPGLDYSLRVGLSYAQQLAKKYSKPLIPIHHMQAHALMPLLENPSIRFPYLALLISGGHCILAICRRYNHFDILGQSLDDAPGDLLDKVARRLRLKNLGEPFDRISGGAAIELLARRQNADKFKYFNDNAVIPMIKLTSCNFSFSGFRGKFDKLVPIFDELWLSGDRDKLTDELGHICSSLQRVMLIQIFRKLQRALLYYRMFWRYKNPEAFCDTGDSHLGFKIRKLDEIDSEYLDVVISGGVAANGYFKESLKSCCDSDIESDRPLNVYAPSASLCGDNGLMIAWNGMLRLLDFNEQTKMDLIKTMASSPIGSDLTKQVTATDFKLPKAKNLELRMR